MTSCVRTYALRIDGSIARGEQPAISSEREYFFDKTLPSSGMSVHGWQLGASQGSLGHP